MSAKKKQRLNFLIFLLIAVNTIFISSWFYKKAQSEPISLEILNGCGKPGIAQKFAEKLQDFNIVRVDNAERFDVPKTRLVVRSKRLKKELPLLEARLNLPEGRQFYLNDPSAIANVTLIIGQDYELVLAGMSTPSP